MLYTNTVTQYAGYRGIPPAAIKCASGVSVLL